MRAIAAAALLLLAEESSGRCLYLGANLRINNYVVLDLTDLSRVMSFDAIGQPDAMVVRNHRLYVNIMGPIGGGTILPGRIVEIDLRQGAVAREFPTGSANFDLAYARGKLYTANFSDDTVTVADPATGLTGTIEGFSRYPSALTGSPDGARVYVGSAYGPVYVIDTAEDRVVETFDSGRAAEDMLVTEDLFLITGVGAGTSGGLRAFRRDVPGHPLAWETDLGFSLGLGIEGDFLFSVSRLGFMNRVDLRPPRTVFEYLLGEQLGTSLWDVTSDAGLVYVAGDEGLFRFEADTVQPALIYRQRLREVVVAPCPGTQSTFAGDADCDSVLAAADVAAAAVGIYDRAARLRCEADCNGDGRVTAADLPCTAQALAAS